MPTYRYVKIGETKATEIFTRVMNPEPFLEKWVRRIKFLDTDDIPMNHYSWFRRVYWTLHFKINCQWIPRLQGHKLYSCTYTVEIPKDREMMTKRIRYIDADRTIV